MEEELRRIFLTGDLHGYRDISALNTTHFPEQKRLTKNDIVIILGDFGLVWDIQERKDERHWKDWLTTRNFTTVVVLGNHENYDRIFQLPETEMFGGTVYQYTESIFILKRGAVYTINGKRFYTLGGAESIDKGSRRLRISWWPEEIPSYAEMNNGILELEQVDFNVDVVLTHTAPTSIIQEYMNACLQSYYAEFGDPQDEEIRKRIKENYLDEDYYVVKQDAVATHLQMLIDDRGLTFDHFFFGHFHDNWNSKDNKYHLLYRSVVELDDYIDYYSE